MPTCVRPCRVCANCLSIHEGVILSTCNRVEVVAAASDHFAAFTEHQEFPRRTEGPSRSRPIGRAHVYTYQGSDAVRHLFRVAASLDSMVVGEPQILGQLKQYYDAARQDRAPSAPFCIGYFIVRFRSPSGCARKPASAAALFR